MFLYYIDIGQYEKEINQIVLLYFRRRLKMRILFIILILFSLKVLANSVNICKGCHPIISAEFEQSRHKKSSIREDKVHKAVWDKHPAKIKNNYKCAKCHTPNNSSHDGMTCMSCHTIIDIEKHPKSNKNIYEQKDKLLYSAQMGMESKKVIYHQKSSWFGLVTKTIGSPYHDIDYTNKNYYTGGVCMGCHSHKQNSKGFEVCRTNPKGAETRTDNCITCHMPKVKGSATNIRISPKHAFHGFAGVRNGHELLSKYVDISYQKTHSGFDIIIHNKAPHNLLTHPLRVVKLKTTLKRDNKIEKLKDVTFVRIIGTDNRPSMPWLATEVVKDTMIKANEKRVVQFNVKLQKGDEIETLLGYYIVNPKAVKKLNLEGDKELFEFIPLKHSYFKN